MSDSESAVRESTQASYRSTIADNDLQTSFPQPEPQSEPPQWLVYILEAMGRFFVGLFESGLLYVAAAILLGYILYRSLPLIEQYLQEGKQRNRPASASGDFSAQEARSAQALLAEADRLAQAGRYSEAVHLLLFRSIEDIAVHRPSLVQPALTARDLCTAEGLPDVPRNVFIEVAAAVEISLFGGRAIDESVWQRCRSDYLKLTIAENWS